jgi:hypothetical protein
MGIPKVSPFLTQRGLFICSYWHQAATMGRTLPSTTQIVFDQIAELKPLYEVLRRSDQLILDKFFEAVLQHRAAIGNTASLLPMEVLPFVIMLEEHKRTNTIHNELYDLIEGLENKLKLLLPPDISQP